MQKQQTLSVPTAITAVQTLREERRGQLHASFLSDGKGLYYEVSKCGLLFVSGYSRVVVTVSEN